MLKRGAVTGALQGGAVAELLLNEHALLLIEVLQLVVGEHLAVALLRLCCLLLRGVEGSGRGSSRGHEVGGVGCVLNLAARLADGDGGGALGAAALCLARLLGLALHVLVEEAV